MDGSQDGSKRMARKAHTFTLVGTGKLGTRTTEMEEEKIEAAREQLHSTEQGRLKDQRDQRKLLNDFKLHEGQTQCLDFHPNEFLLATAKNDWKKTSTFRSLSLSAKTWRTENKTTEKKTGKWEDRRTSC